MKLQLLISVFVLTRFFSLCKSQNKVLLREVTSITLRRGEKTAGRRSTPIPQLQCNGGTAQGRFSPKTVQCYNRGFDGIDVQWECQTDMPREYQFGRVSVSCEGYDYPTDPYILPGSCGLIYELDYSSTGVKGNAFLQSPYQDHTTSYYTYFFYLIIIGFVFYMLYLTVTSSREGHEGDRFRGYGGGGYPGDGGGGGGGGGGPPPPYGWQPPPSYGDSPKGFSTNSHGGSSGGTGFSGPGFFSGLGLGALGSYLYSNYLGGRNEGYGARHRRPYQSYQNTGSSYFDQYNEGEPGPSYFSTGESSSATHTSSGFGGTERR